jgi:peptidoglycan/LPS O-acetylase OafA/YrhL
LAIIWSMECSPWQRVLESPMLQYLGSRSFSLYLVHEPVVVAYAFALHGRPGLIGLLTVALPVALVLSEAFYRLVEQPSLNIARRLGGRATRTPTSVLAR